MELTRVSGKLSVYMSDRHIQYRENVQGCIIYILFFFFKQKTAYEIKECDWSSDVCSSDLARPKSLQKPDSEVR